MGAHSPGPWSVHPHFSSRVIGPDESKIADVSYRPHTEEDANARLIAAAPEMLEMLRRLEWEADEEYCLACGNLERSGHMPDCELSALIRKAGGEP